MREMEHTLAFVPGSAAKLAAKDFHDINSSPLPSDLLRPAPRRPAPTRRENTTTVQCAANCVRSRTLAAQCGGAVRLRAPGTNASACAISLTHSLPPPPCLLTHRGLLGPVPERSELPFDTCIRTFPMMRRRRRACGASTSSWSFSMFTRMSVGFHFISSLGLF